MAAEPPLAAGSYKYITVDQSVNDALTEFGRNIGVPVQVSKLVPERRNADRQDAMFRISEAIAHGK